MIIEPKVRGFICTTAHPDGCAAHVQQQIDYVRQQQKLSPIKNVLIIGCSTGYGLATRIVAALACEAKTLGVMFERPASGKRTATAGWYNTAAFEEYATLHKLYAKTINGDAFSNEVKQSAIDIIKNDMPEGIDLIIYSLASPRRTDPITGDTFNSCLKTVGKPYRERSVNILTSEITNVEIEPASEQEIADTVKVMGGEDWQLWMSALLDAKLLKPHVQTIAYTYIGPEITYPIYRQGTIGKAKEHLEKTAATITEQLAALNGKATISVNKAVVTQASSAIPVVPLYAAVLYKVMKQHDTHEDCIEQIYRLFKDYLCAKQPKALDENGFIRLDDLELHNDIQKEVTELWSKVDKDNIEQITDIIGYRNDFFRLFGFGLPTVDYQADVEAERDIGSIK
jgi:enoyl-[acyl-carrier protein] reductase/trans-2-enoyl-CoA reductase (NAD+)